MSMPQQPLTSLARHTMWINNELIRHFGEDGRPRSPDATEHLDIALQALDNNEEARQIARHLAKAYQHTMVSSLLTDWWVTNLASDPAADIWQRERELARGAAETRQPGIRQAYKATLAELLTTPATAQQAGPTRFAGEALHVCWVHLEQQDTLAGPVREVLESQAPAIARAVPAGYLLPLLENTQNFGLPALKAAGLDELHRADLPQLRNWHTQAHHAGNGELKQALANHYQTRLETLSETSPCAAWEEVGKLRQMRDEGRLTIVPPEEATTSPIFNRFAAQVPAEAASYASLDIKAAGADRLTSLSRLQASMASQSSEQQLAFFSHLHTALMHEPDLAAPSRAHILHLVQACPAASGLHDEAYRLALGDDVLQNQLRPVATPPAAATSSQRPPLLQRARQSLKRFLAN